MWKGEGLVKYLGIFADGKRILIATYKATIDRIKKELASWKTTMFLLRESC